MHKAGYVNIIGKPNAGKSTLMNAMLGEQLSIVNKKAQTTRHRVIGLYNEKDLQIAFSDTPGIIDPAYKLQEAMMHFVEKALEDADIFLLIFDVSTSNDFAFKVFEKINKLKKPILLALNKIDLIDQKKLVEITNQCEDQLSEAEIIPISAKNNFNIDYLFKRIKALIPESPPYFDKESLSNKPVRFFIAEIIRGKLLHYYQKEIPYSVEILIDSYNDKETIVDIRAIIIVSRESQKGIIIGHKGAAIKKLGTKSRIEIESFIQKKVFLELYVKVDKNWRNNKDKLKKYGYWQK